MESEREAQNVPEYRANSTRHALIQHGNVIKAVMLRDLRSRFFNNGFGFLVVILWPLAHMAILLIIYRLAGRVAPYGDSLNVFFATGLIPTLLFMYVSRFMSLSVVMNRPMMAFPVVHALDIMIGRGLLEALAGAILLALVFTIFFAVGDNPMPIDPAEAVEAYATALLLAVGMGTLASVLTLIYPVFSTVYALMMMLVYVSSGTLFVASSLPSAVAVPLSWNPILQCVEWMRTAYYPTYSDELLSKSYVVCFGLGALLLGLLLERMFRGVIVENS